MISFIFDFINHAANYDIMKTFIIINERLKIVLLLYIMSIFKLERGEVWTTTKQSKPIKPIIRRYAVDILTEERVVSPSI